MNKSKKTEKRKKGDHLLKFGSKNKAKKLFKTGKTRLA